MTKQRCEGCRWFRYDMLFHGKPHGVCRRNAPVGGEFSEVSGDNMCGEWQDKDITPEQAERRGLVQQLAVAIVQGMCASNSSIGYTEFPAFAWRRAEQIAEAEGQR